ncbi:MAG: FG-GAP-like repeat-containing protein, partial [Thermodesulfobacteriota bacterium]|nr:FG-GAP-like repeat-containing protein [Thermodesulfobacteriota bacterium]
MCIYKHSIWKHLVVIGVLSVTLLGSSFIAQAEETDYDPDLNPQLIQPGFLTKSINISNSGTAAFNIPIEVPPGRGGIAVPSLSLQYVSNGSNGWIGVGWNLDVGSIQRNTKYGLDYSGSDFVVNGSTELVSRTDWGTGYFGAKIEEAFTRYEFISAESGWIATHKDGTRYYYGRNADSRQENANGVFKWCLDQIEDTNDNTLSVEYVKDQGQIYPGRINYTDDLNYVIFALEDRPDITVSYNTHSEVKTAKRLTGISVYGHNQPAREYVMQYEIGSSSARSRLNQINVDPLPPITITYQEGGNGLYDVDNYHAEMNTSGISAPNVTFFADVNGDSRSDLIKCDLGNIYTYLGQNDGSFSVANITSGVYILALAGYLQTGDVNGDGLVDLITRSQTIFYRYHTFLANPNRDGTFIYVGHSDTSYSMNIDREMLADLNRDGRADLIKFISGSVIVHFARSDGSGLFEQTPIQSLNFLSSSRTSMGDVNGDGLPDLISPFLGGGPGVRVHFANEDGTFQGNGIITYVPENPFSLFQSAVDINADGLTDLITYSDTESLTTLYQNVHVYLSTGDGTFDTPVQTTVVRHDELYGAFFFSDVNGDGYPDLIHRDRGNQDVFTYDYFLNIFLGNGDGTFSNSATTIQWELGNANMECIFFADINGDGKDDFISQDNSDFYSYFAAGSPPDLLTSKTDSYGAITTVEYTPSSNFLNYGLPYVVQTVSSVEVDDGLGTVSTTTYSYNEGYYDVVEREYRGFHQVSQTNPDSTQAFTYYHVLDDVKKGKKYRAESKDPSDNLMILLNYDWGVHPFGETDGHADFVKLIAQDAIYHDSPTAWVGWHADLVYDDDNGNLLSKSYLGDAAESITLSYSYANYGDWNWRRTLQTLVGSASGKVRETAYEYFTGTGNLMWKEPWLSDGSHPTRINYTYDGYGNVQAVTDARGNVTTTEYESVLHAHPSRVISPSTGGTSH